MPCWISMETTKVISTSRRNTGRCQLNTQFYQKKAFLNSPVTQKTTKLQNRLIKQ